MQLRSCLVLAGSVLLGAILSGCAVSCGRTHWYKRTLKGAVHDAQTQTDLDLDGAAFVDIDDDDLINPLSVKGKANARYKNLIIVSTLDGKLTALDGDHDGQLLWSINVGAKPLLSSSISRLEVSRNGKNSRLIPSLDGSLYQFNGDDMERLPFTSDTLLSSSSRLTEDTMVVGNRDVSVFGVSPYTGLVKYICGSDGCGHNEDTASDEDIITIKRRSHMVRAISIASGEEKWNFSVGQHDIEFIDSCNNQSDEPFFVSHLPLKIHVPDGVVVANSDGDLDQELWRHKFSSPVTKAWRLLDGTLEEISMFDCKYVPTLYDGKHILSSQPMLYFGMHHGQLYVQPSVSGMDPPHIAVDEYVRHYITNGGQELAKRVPKLRWKPYLATASSRTPHIRNNPFLIDYDGRSQEKKQNNKNDRQGNDDDYPYDSGYFLIPDVTYLPDFIPELEDRSSRDYQTEENGNETDYLIYINESIWVWWKEIIAISLCTSLLVQVLLNHVFFRRTVPAAVESGSKERTTSESSKSDEADYQKPGICFVSRFHTDFNVIETLGRGGFGVVFKAKNKMDELEYAVKRICVKNTPESREKVLREARAMAKLDHIGIIRYYQVFVETPPVGWQKMKDLELFGPELTSTMSAPVTETPASLEPVNSILPEAVSKQLKNPLQLFDYSISESGSFEKGDFTTSDSLEIIFENTDSQKSKVPFSLPTKTDNINDSGCSETSTQKGDGDQRLPQTETESESSLSVSKSATNSIASCSGSFSVKNVEDESPPLIEKPPKLYLYIQMQLCERHTLKDWLSANTLKRDCNLMLDYFTQIVNAVAYVHECSLIHRDLKPSNIYFSVNDNNIIKVGDFGLVTAHEEQPEDIYDECAKDAQGHTNQVGTQLYMSPEQTKGLPYGQKVDIFSLGLIFLEFFYPCSTQMEKIAVLSDAKRQKLPPRFSRELKQESDFVRWLTHEDPCKRPTAAEMLESELLKDVVPSTSSTMMGHRRTNSMSSKRKR